MVTNAIEVTTWRRLKLEWILPPSPLSSKNTIDIPSIYIKKILIE